MMAGQDRPSPRKLSDLFMQGDDGIPSMKNRTALFAFFGKFLLPSFDKFFESEKNLRVLLLSKLKKRQHLNLKKKLFYL